MRFVIFIFILFQLPFLNAQETIKTNFFKTILLKADTFIGVDDFENYYYIKDNTLYKKTNQQIYTYTNTQLGKITSVDITNPLKILLFYRDFNTVLFLDNRLNELTSPFNFTTASFSKNITFVTVASTNNLWLYSLDDTILQLWNYQTNKVQFTSQPISFYTDDFKVIKQLSSYKNCWLVGEGSVLKFNEYGVFLDVSKIQNTTDLKPFQKGYIYVKDNKLYYQNNVINLQIIDATTKLTIKNYAVNTRYIYIFDGAKVFTFRIIKNK